jgi:hypothetical protein
MMMSTSHIPFVKEFINLRSSRMQIFETESDFRVWRQAFWNDRLKKLEFGFQLFKKMDLGSKPFETGARYFLRFLRVFVLICGLAR